MRERAQAYLDQGKTVYAAGLMLKLIETEPTPGSVNLIWPLLIFSFGSTPSGESTPAARRSEALRRP
jgi:hypothetical protein